MFALFDKPLRKSLTALGTLTAAGSEILQTIGAVPERIAGLDGEQIAATATAAGVAAAVIGLRRAVGRATFEPVEYLGGFAGALTDAIYGGYAPEAPPPDEEPDEEDEEPEEEVEDDAVPKSDFEL